MHSDEAIQYLQQWKASASPEELRKKLEQSRYPADVIDDAIATVYGKKESHAGDFILGCLLSIAVAVFSGIIEHWILFFPLWLILVVAMVGIKRRWIAYGMLLLFPIILVIAITVILFFGFILDF